MKLVVLLLLASFNVSATVFTVGVGKDETTGRKGVGYDPSVIFPGKDYQIVFKFWSGSHSVVESTFDQPCTPRPGGFDSGVKTVPENLDVDAPGLPTVTLAAKDSQPSWFFDQAGGTCNEGGVFAVNPTGSQTPGAIKDKAMKAIMAPVNSSSNASSGSSSSATPTSSSLVQGTQRASKTNAGAAIAASQVALSSLAAIMLGVAMGML